MSPRRASRRASTSTWGEPGTSKAKALQQAQVGLLDDYDHPFFWAPFLLIGNWL